MNKLIRRLQMSVVAFALSVAMVNVAALPIQISINDVSRAEGTGAPGFMNFVFTITALNPCQTISIGFGGGVFGNDVPPVFQRLFWGVVRQRGRL